MKKQIPLLISLTIPLLGVASTACAKDFTPAPINGASTSFTTTEAVGKTIKLYVNGQTDNLWIDLNGNSTYDKGERIERGTWQTFTVQSQTLTMYGDPTELNCRANRFSSLNVSKLTKLTSLLCYDNQLTSLDLSNLTDLEVLACSQNKLTSLDLSKLTKLMRLDSYENLLKNLDVSKLTKLTKFTCDQNKLTSINVSNLTNLTWFSCSNNRISNLKVGNLSKLQEFDCSQNQIESLDISNLIQLTKLDCYKNQLKSLDVSKLTNLVTFDCSENQIESLDISNLTKLTKFYGHQNKLAKLDVRKLHQLNKFSCYQNKIKKAEMQKIVEALPHTTGDARFFPYNPAPMVNEYNQCAPDQVKIAVKKGWRVLTPELNEFTGVEIAVFAPAPTSGARASFTTTKGTSETLTLYVNGAKNSLWVDLNDNSAYDKGEELINDKFDTPQEFSIQSQKLAIYGDLTGLNCAGNQIRSIDVSNLAHLTKLYCEKNELTSLDISQQKELIELQCSNNKIKEAEMQKVVEALPKVTVRAFFWPYNPNKEENQHSKKEENQCTPDQVKIAVAKGWNVLDDEGNDFPGVEAVEDISASQLSIVLVAKEGVLLISGLEAGMPVVVYTIDGTSLYRGTPTSSEMSIPLSTGSYVLRIGNYSAKAIMP